MHLIFLFMLLFSMGPVFTLTTAKVSNTIDFETTILEASCFNARELPRPDPFCDFVSWSSAYYYTASNYSLYNPGQPLSNTQQGLYAQYIYGSYTEGKPSLSTDCASALKRLACVEAFPSCPTVGDNIGSVAYFPACKLQCLQATSVCNRKSQGTVPVDCSSYPEINCNIYVPPGYFVLPQSQGPYEPLEILYITTFLFWVSMALAWNYLTFYVHKNRCVLLCRAVSGIPVIKAVVTIFALAFWSTCVSTKMCSFWLGVSLTNTHLVYETGEMMVFILVSKGWSITRESFSPNEWRTIIMIMSGFYMVNSILLVLESSVLTRRDFWIANAVLYGSVYLFILFNGLKNIKFLYNETMLLKPTMPSEFRGPLIAKYRMFICLLVIVFVSMAMEVYCHSLVATDGRLWTVLMAYEISNILIMGILGIVFRPIEYSPFFFMVSTQHFDAGHMPMTVLDIADEHEDGHEDNVVELAPLIADNNRDLRDDEETDGRPSKLVIIKFPDSTIALGARN